MKRKWMGVFLTVLIMVVGLCVSVQAELVDMGDGTIYDTDAQLSWLKDVNTTKMTWDQAAAWAAGLNGGGGFAGLTGWRLPASDTCENYNCVNSEMGHLYYIELGNAATGPLVNTGPFTNMQADALVNVYWPGTEYALQTLDVYVFQFNAGFQGLLSKTYSGDYALAVCPGERIAVSEFVPPGSDLTVDPAPGIELTFDSVTTGGNVRIREVKAEAAPLDNKKLLVIGEKMYSIDFDGGFNGSVKMCLSYKDSDVAANEKAIKLYHKDKVTAELKDITTSLDTNENKVCGVTTSFSEFAVVETLYGALVDMGDGTIYDKDTQLSWLKDAGSGGTRTFAEANAWAAGLNSGGGFAGLTGWRLPAADPACNGGANCTNSELGHLYYIDLGNVWGGPLTNIGPFTNLYDSYYWTGTLYTADPPRAWYFLFNNGAQSDGDATTDTRYAWAVSPGARSVPSNLVDMCDGTIYDTDKQLSWLQDAGTSGLINWDAAIAWVASLNNNGGFAGLTGWRLPTTIQPDATCQDQAGGASQGLNCTKSEMGHLFYTELGNTAGGSPSHNAGPFTNVTDFIYWTSTDWPPDPSAAFAFYRWDGGQYGYLKFGNYYAWAVRSGERNARIEKPFASFYWTPDTVTSYTVNFNAIGSVCVAGRTCTYGWDFGDGGTGTGVTTSHTYADETPMSVTLTISDGTTCNVLRSQTVTPTAVNQPPVPIRTVTINNMTVTVVDNSTDEDPLPANAVTIWWGDGTSDTQNARTTFTHTYTSPATYILKQYVRDAGGMLGRWTNTDGSDLKVVVPSSTTKYAISGTVRNGVTSEGISGASVVLKKNGITQKSVQTDASGYYELTGLDSGTYTLTATKSGYDFDAVTAGKQSISPAQTVALGSDSTVNFTATP